MIRIDSIWLEPMGMRAATETALAGVVTVFGTAQPHCAYLFANRRANRIKVLVHDGWVSGWRRAACIKVSSSGRVLDMPLKWSWRLGSCTP